ncbi:MAG: hypothetical protein ACM3U1_04565 [Chloroflexota bacterium]
MKQLLLFIILSFVVEARSQDFPPLMPETEAEAEFHGYSDYVETLERLRLNPLRLKRVKPSELLALPGISPRIAAAIVDYARNRDPYSIKEIADSLGLSPDLELVLTYCATISGEPLNGGRIDFRSRQSQSLTPSRGFREAVYQGSPLESYQRLNAAYEGFELTACWEKDAGERPEQASASGALFWRAESFSAAAGDYSLAFGLGALLGRAFPAVKSAEVIAPAAAYYSETKPNSSSYFSKKLRGVVAELFFSGGERSVKAFYSDQKRAGALDAKTGAITSLYSSGLYRTEGEIAKVGAARERIAGAQVETALGAVSLGAAGYFIEYDKRINTESKANFKGRRGALAEVFAAMTLEKYSLAAEVARDAGNSFACVAAAEGAFGAWELAGRARFYPAEFRSPLGSGFGESSTPSNEAGLYVAARRKLTDSARLSLYADLFAAPGRTYNVSKPVTGVDLFAQLDIKLRNLTFFSLRTRFETKNDDMEKDNKLIDFRRSKLSLRFDVKKSLRSIGDARIVADFRQVDLGRAAPAEFGAAAFIELSRKAGNWLEASARATAFSTDGYDSAVWQYEQLLPGRFSVPPLYERGSRFSARLRLTPLAGLNITAVYASMSKNYRESMGSGWDEIPLNHSGTFYLQIDARY